MTVAATRFTGWATTHPTSVTLTGPENVTWGNMAAPAFVTPGGGGGSAGPTTGRIYPERS